MRTRLHLKHQCPNNGSIELFWQNNPPRRNCSRCSLQTSSLQQQQQQQLFANLIRFN